LSKELIVKKIKKMAIKAIVTGATGMVGEGIHVTFFRIFKTYICATGMVGEGSPRMHFEKRCRKSLGSE
jgi:hypothetical protein